MNENGKLCGLTKEINLEYFSISLNFEKHGNVKGYFCIRQSKLKINRFEIVNGMFVEDVDCIKFTFTVNWKKSHSSKVSTIFHGHYYNTNGSERFCADWLLGFDKINPESGFFKSGKLDSNLPLTPIIDFPYPNFNFEL